MSFALATGGGTDGGLVPVKYAPGLPAYVASLWRVPTSRRVSAQRPDSFAGVRR